LRKGDRIANGRLHRTGLTLVSGPPRLALIHMKLAL